MPCNLEASLQCCGRDHLSVLKFVLVLAPTGPLAHDKAPLKCPLSYFRGLVCRCRVCVGGCCDSTLCCCGCTAARDPPERPALGSLLVGGSWGPLPLSPLVEDTGAEVTTSSPRATSETLRSFWLAPAGQGQLSPLQLASPSIHVA